MFVLEAIYVGPHLLLANTQRGVPPPPREERRRGPAARDGCRASTAVALDVIGHSPHYSTNWRNSPMFTC